MSARYSTSPTLTLTTGRSRIRRCLWGALCLCAATAHWLLFVRGYPLSSALLLFCTLPALLRLGRDSLVGATLGWSGGRWTLHAGGSSRPVRVLPASCCLPGLVHVALEELPGGRRRSLWLFRDSADPDQLRRLRARLAVER